MEKEKALSTALQQIERSYGKGSIMKLGEVAANRDVSVIPTGSLPLDLALGVGGVPRGRVVEIYGPESAARLRSPCTSSPRPRSRAESPPSSTPSTPSTPSMPLESGSTSTSS